MSLILITPPALEPISLDEARAQCRIDGTADDALLAVYIQAARQQAEARTGRAFVTQTWEQRVDAFPTGAEGIRIDKPRVLSITAVTYIDTAGATQTLAPSAYTLDADVSPGWLFPADGTEWPDTDDVINAVRVQFTAGYGPAATDVPAPVRSWMLLTIGYLYAQREAIDTMGKASAIPARFVDSLLDAEIVYGL